MRHNSRNSFQSHLGLISSGWSTRFTSANILSIPPWSDFFSSRSACLEPCDSESFQSHLGLISSTAEERLNIIPHLDLSIPPWSDFFLVSGGIAANRPLAFNPTLV